MMPLRINQIYKVLLYEVDDIFEVKVYSITREDNQNIYHMTFTSKKEKETVNTKYSQSTIERFIKKNLWTITTITNNLPEELFTI